MGRAIVGPADLLIGRARPPFLTVSRLGMIGKGSEVNPKVVNATKRNAYTIDKFDRLDIIFVSKNESPNIRMSEHPINKLR